MGNEREELNFAPPARVFLFEAAERAAVVNEKTLAMVAKSINLHENLRLGKGELQTGGAQKPSILSSAFEALIAAIYLDGISKGQMLAAGTGVAAAPVALAVVIVPGVASDLAALWHFVRSTEYAQAVKRLNQKVIVTVSRTP